MGKNIFNSVKMAKPKKSAFDLTHDVKQTMRFGELTPILAMECIPGDKIKLSAETLVRFAPLISPVMHRMDASIHYFFVPYRILWQNWEKFITSDGQTNVPAHPTILIRGEADGELKDSLRLADYLGIPPPPTGQNAVVSAFPHAAYQKIYNDYYRDQNLIQSVEPVSGFMLTDGDNALATGLKTMRTRAWEHDYFTACLPWAQKGQQVLIPVSGNGTVTLDTTQQRVGKFVSSATGLPVGTVNENIEANYPGVDGNVTGAGNTLVYDPNGSLKVGGGVDSGTINDLRTASALQKWLERNARGGTRYVESILTHFGVKSSDKRMQRPEYICGLKTPIIISEVLNTSGVDQNDPTTKSPAQGNMAGHGIAVHSGKGASYYCEEHGLIMGIMSIIPKTAYQQGINRMYLKRDPLTYFWPEFAHLGEQEVLLEEVYSYSGQDPQKVFGYVPRYAEYKYQPSRVAGNFRDTLAFWHLGRIFANEPQLNQEFVECKPDTRIFAVVENDVDNIYVDVLNRITAIRPMPKFGTPTL